MNQNIRRKIQVQGEEGYEICLIPTGKIGEYRMGLLEKQSGRMLLAPRYCNIAEDMVRLAGGKNHLLFHTTREEGRQYLHGCYEAGYGWLAGGEHLHLERIMISGKRKEQEKAICFWVYDRSKKEQYSYRHVLYDKEGRELGSFATAHAGKEPYEEIEYLVGENELRFFSNGKQIYILKKIYEEKGERKL